MRVLLTAFIFTLSHWALAEDSAGLIQDYDQTSWQVSDTGAQIAAFEDQLAAWQQLDDTSEVLMWRGAVAASIARAKGGVGAFGLLKQAKKDLMPPFRLTQITAWRSPSRPTCSPRHRVGRCRWATRKRPPPDSPRPWLRIRITF